MMSFKLMFVMFLARISAENPIHDLHLASSYAVVGDSFQMSCYIKQPCSTTKWTWFSKDGSQSIPLTFDGAPTEDSYRQITNSDSFTLVIHNLTERDINGYFECVCDVFNRIGQIPLDRIVVLPTSNEVRRLVNLAPTSVQVSISISRIFPIPECICSLGEKTLELEMTKERIGLYYRVKIALNRSITARERCSLLTVQCNILSRKDLWDGINMQSQNANCDGNGGNKFCARLEIWIASTICYILFMSLFG